MAIIKGHWSCEIYCLFFMSLWMTGATTVFSLGCFVTVLLVLGIAGYCCWLGAGSLLYFIFAFVFRSSSVLIRFGNSICDCWAWEKDNLANAAKVITLEHKEQNVVQESHVCGILVYFLHSILRCKPSYRSMALHVQITLLTSKQISWFPFISVQIHFKAKSENAVRYRHMETSQKKYYQA